MLAWLQMAVKIIKLNFAGEYIGKGLTQFRDSYTLHSNKIDVSALCVNADHTRAHQKAQTHR